ncbi:MAG: hypothetical protein LBG28_15775 [Tannerella sp.]|jgi:hypothetical protein|nr:hypothetical protein [Tannerella sp.]
MNEIHVHRINACCAVTIRKMVSFIQMVSVFVHPDVDIQSPKCLPHMARNGI